MHAGHSDVLDHVDVVPEATSDSRCLAGHGMIGGSRGHHCDRTLSDDRNGVGTDPEETALGVVASFTERISERHRDRGLDTRGEHGLARFEQRACDRGDLGRILPGRVDHLGKPRAERAMRIDPRMRNIDEGETRKRLDRRLGPELTAPDAFQKLAQPLAIQANPLESGEDT